MATETETIVVVEDNHRVRWALGQLLRAADFDVLTFGSAEEFLASDLRASVYCLIADINLPGMSGVALLKALPARGPVPPAILITANDDAATLEMIRQAAPVRHLRKPFADEELFQAIKHARLG